MKKIFIPTPEQHGHQSVDEQLDNSKGKSSHFTRRDDKQEYHRLKPMVWGFIAVVALAFLVSAGLAQAIITSSANSTSTTAIRQEIQILRQQTFQQIEQQRLDLRTQIDAKMQALQQQIAAKKEALKNTITQKKAQLEKKLKLIKDTVRQNIVLNINDQIQKLNEVLTNHFLAVLTQLEKVLANITSRANKAETAGKDISAVKTAIDAAQKAIDSSRTTVKTQALKIYTISVSSGTTSSTGTTTRTLLKVDVGKTRKLLHDDLVAVRNTVFAARDAVHNAATTLGKIQGIDDLKISSSTPATNPDTDATTSTSTIY